MNGKQLVTQKKKVAKRQKLSYRVKLSAKSSQNLAAIIQFL
jgi:hypothetical protein